MLGLDCIGYDLFFVLVVVLDAFVSRECTLAPILLNKHASYFAACFLFPEHAQTKGHLIAYI